MLSNALEALAIHMLAPLSQGAPRWIIANGHAAHSKATLGVADERIEPRGKVAVRAILTGCAVEQDTPRGALTLILRDDSSGYCA